MDPKETIIGEARILGCASQGTGSGDEARLRALLANFRSSFVPFDHARKRNSFFACLDLLRAGDFDLFVLEGTGFAAGMAAILGRILWRRPYVLSSGDAVAPFLSSLMPAGALLFGFYERLLYRCCAGFIGWTPYLVGRALTLGARRAATIPGWAPYIFDPLESARARLAIRSKFGIPEDAVVFGMAGSLVWSKRFEYCYGAELVRASARAHPRAYVLIVGDGSGVEHLRRLAGDNLDKTVFLTGRVAREEVPRYLAAMDVGSLPQTVDGIGSFRYTTKLPEYRSAGLLITTNHIPVAYDLDRGDMLRVPGDSPWSDVFISALAELMQRLTRSRVLDRKAALGDSIEFSRDTQIARMNAFLTDILKSLPPGGSMS